MVFFTQHIGFPLQALETQLSKIEDEKLKLLVEVNEYKSTAQTLKEELLESQHKATQSEKEKIALQELLKSEELIRDKVGKIVFLPTPFFSSCGHLI